MQKYANLIDFLQKLISKKHVIVIMEFPDWIQVKMKILGSEILRSIHNDLMLFSIKRHEIPLR